MRGGQGSARVCRPVSTSSRRIAQHRTWLNLRLKADMLAKEGKTAEAIGFAERAIEKGKKDTPADEVTKIEKQVAEWKAKK